jgi:hypothetical protein
MLIADGTFSQEQQSGGEQQTTDQNIQTGDSSRGQRTQVGRDRDRDQIQQRMTERYKELLECSDEEWQVLGPKVLNVYSLSNQSRTGSVRMVMGRTNQRNRSSGNQDNESLTKLEELLENKDATTSEIKRLVSEVRKEREKSQEELAKAQMELRELLTVRQEAILITLGLLD